MANSVEPAIRGRRVVAGGPDVGQPQYLAIVTKRNQCPGHPPTLPENAVTMAFRLEPWERDAIQRGEDLYVTLLTFGRPQNPIIVTVGAQPMADALGVEVEK